MVRKKWKDPITGEDFVPVYMGQQPGAAPGGGRGTPPPGGRGTAPGQPGGQPPGGAQGGHALRPDGLALLALRIEQAYSKDKIFELYLNEIYLGLGSYGIAAAALNYFDKALYELTLSEAAYIAALPPDTTRVRLPSTGKRRPASPPLAPPPQVAPRSTSPVEVTPARYTKVADFSAAAVGQFSEFHRPGDAFQVAVGELGADNKPYLVALLTVDDEVLASVALIAAEDTRHTGKLLKHFDIETPITSSNNVRIRRAPPLAIKVITAAMGAKNACG